MSSGILFCINKINYKELFIIFGLHVAQGLNERGDPHDIEHVRLKPNPAHPTFATTCLHLQTNDVSIQVNGEAFLHWIALNSSLDNDRIVIRR
jgi:hypothetical protein